MVRHLNHDHLRMALALLTLVLHILLVTSLIHHVLLLLRSWAAVVLLGWHLLTAADLRPLLTVDLRINVVLNLGSLQRL